MSHNPHPEHPDYPGRVDVSDFEQDNVISASPLLVDTNPGFLAVTIATRDDEPIILAFGPEDINDWQRILNDEKTAPKVAPFETVDELGNGSVATAYLNKRSQNTGVTYGTWSGEKPDQDDHVVLIVHRDTVVDMIHEGPQLVSINPGCVEAHTQAARAAQEKREAARRAEEDAKRSAREASERRMEEAENIYRLIGAHRSGDTTAVAEVLDTLVAEDDKTLASLGMTSWDDEEDEK